MSAYDPNVWSQRRRQDAWLIRNGSLRIPPAKRDPVVVVFYAIGFVVSGISLIIAITSPWWM